jgi:hypothetical protein
LSACRSCVPGRPGSGTASSGAFGDVPPLQTDNHGTTRAASSARRNSDPSPFKRPSMPCTLSSLPLWGESEGLRSRGRAGGSHQLATLSFSKWRPRNSRWVDSVIEEPMRSVGWRSMPGAARAASAQGSQGPRGTWISAVRDDRGALTGNPAAGTRRGRVERLSIAALSFAVRSYETDLLGPSD